MTLGSLYQWWGDWGFPPNLCTRPATRPQVWHFISHCLLFPHQRNLQPLFACLPALIHCITSTCATTSLLLWNPRCQVQLVNIHSTKSCCGLQEARESQHWTLFENEGKRALPHKNLLPTGALSGHTLATQSSHVALTSARSHNTGPKSAHTVKKETLDKPRLMSWPNKIPFPT